MFVSCEYSELQTEVSVSGCSLIQRSPTDCGGSNECDHEVS